jgi:FkbM family methyltransferase
MPSFKNKVYSKLTRLSNILGGYGLYLLPFKQLKKNPCPAINVPIFGNISNYNEIINLHDNFGVGELRDWKVEQAIREAEHPVIIDCGINVGITVRWWFYLNQDCNVHGVDMMEETHSFTQSKLGPETDQYHPNVCALYSEPGVAFDVPVFDPFYGENSLDMEIKEGAENRQFVSQTLDQLFGDDKEVVVLLKIDLEGAGGKALAGGEKLLDRVQHVIFETHDEEETKLASMVLARKGFALRRMARRNMWWEKIEEMIQ